MPLTSVGSLAIAAVVALTALPPAATAESAFDGTSGGVARRNLGLEGGHVEDLAVASNGTVYAALDSPNGLFCSTDGGASWSGPPPGTDLGAVAQVEVGETPDTAYVIGGIKLFRTVDRCATFSELTVAGASHSDFDKSMAFAGGVLLVAFRDGTVVRTTDGGATLAKVVVGAGVTKVNEVAASPTPGTFWALVVANGVPAVFRSTNGGADWTDASGGFACNGCTRLRVDPADPLHLLASGFGGVARSDDGSASWHDVSPIGVAGNAPAFVGGRIFVGAQYSDDDGAHWADLNQIATHDTELFNVMTPDSAAAGLLYMASSRGVAKSTDGGTSWTDVVHGLTGVQVSGIAQSTDKETVYLAATAGLARSTDFTTGPTWTYPLDVTGAGNRVTAVALPDPAAPATVLAATADGAEGIWRSTDGGAHFDHTAITSSSFGNRHQVTDFAVAGDGRILAAHEDRQSQTGGVLVSTDGGATWSDLPFPPVEANAVVVVGDAVLIGTGGDFDPDPSYRGVFRLVGSEWAAIQDPAVDGALVLDLAVVPPATVYAAVGQQDRGTVLRSTDGGVTWTDLHANGLPNDGWFRSLAVDPKDTNVVYAASGRPAGPAVIYRTTDGGASWTDYYDGLTDEVPSTMLVDGLMVGFNTGLFGFDPVACRLRQIGKKTLAVDLTLADAAVTDLAARGIANAAADLARMNKKGKAVGKTATASFGAQAAATFKFKKKGTYRATCHWVERDQQTVEAQSATLKTKKKPPH